MFSLLEDSTWPTVPRNPIHLKSAERESMTLRKDLFIFCWFWIKQISSVHGSADLFGLGHSKTPRSLRRSEEHSRWQFTGISGWFALDKMQLQNHPKVVYWDMWMHTSPLHYHTYPTSGTFRFCFLNGNTVNFAMAKTCMWMSLGFSVWINLEINLFHFGLYFAMCFIVLLCHLNIFTITGRFPNYIC